MNRNRERNSAKSQYEYLIMVASKSAFLGPIHFDHLLWIRLSNLMFRKPMECEQMNSWANRIAIKWAIEREYAEEGLWNFSIVSAVATSTTANAESKNYYIIH